MANIVVKRKASGPAVTFTVKVKGFHRIDVDLSPSIPWEERTLQDFGWPRPETENVLEEDVIGDIINAGLHLVPKDLQLWLISVSNAERVLMKKIDSEDRGCRKKCHKLLKRDVNEWKQWDDLKGISTIIFKVRSSF